jgi:hypothetical protein
MACSPNARPLYACSIRICMQLQPVLLGSILRLRFAIGAAEFLKKLKNPVFHVETKCGAGKLYAL